MLESNLKGKEKETEARSQEELVIHKQIMKPGRRRGKEEEKEKGGRKTCRVNGRSQPVDRE